MAEAKISGTALVVLPTDRQEYRSFVIRGTDLDTAATADQTDDILSDHKYEFRPHPIDANACNMWVRVSEDPPSVHANDRDACSYVVKNRDGTSSPVYVTIIYNDDTPPSSTQPGPKRTRG